MISQSMSSTSSSINSKMRAQNPIEKAKRSVSTVFQKIRSRFRSASLEFRKTIDAEGYVADLEANIEAEKNSSLRQLQLGGYLVSARSEEVLPLYEGLNYIAILETGKAKWVPAYEKEKSNFQCDYRILVNEQSIEVEFLQMAKEKVQFETNERIGIGIDNYCLKLFPKEYRLETLVNF